MKRWLIASTGLASMSIVAAVLFLPFFSPDDRLVAHLPSNAELYRERILYPDTPWDSPYGRTQAIEKRIYERRNLLDVLNDRTSAIVVSHTDRGLVAERASSASLDLSRRATVTYTELSPSDVPAGVLTAALQSTHRGDFRTRGTLQPPRDTGGHSDG